MQSLIDVTVRLCIGVLCTPHLEIVYFFVVQSRVESMHSRHRLGHALVRRHSFLSATTSIAVLPMLNYLEEDVSVEWALPGMSWRAHAVRFSGAQAA